MTGYGHRGNSAPFVNVVFSVWAIFDRKGDMVERSNGRNSHVPQKAILVNEGPLYTISFSLASGFKINMELKILTTW